MDTEKKEINGIDTRSLVDRVYEYLLNQIIEGSIRYGEQINTKEIAKVLNISTMPVREAIKKLEYDQIVEIKPRSKCQVKEPTKKMIKDIYELREVLEAYALTKSINHVDEKQLDNLRSITNKMREVRNVTDIDLKEKMAIKLDRLFHAELCKLANNSYLNYFYRQLNLHVNMTLIHEKTYHSLENQYYESHAEIVEALSKGSRNVKVVLKKHFDNVKGILFDNSEY